MRGHLAQARDGEDHEPDRHDRSEHAADTVRPPALDREQGDKDGERDRDDEVLEARRGDLQALDRRQDGDGGGDHAVAVEQRRADDAEEYQGRGLGPGALDERGEGHDAALAFVARAHDEGHVLDRDDQRERPEHERDDAVDVAFGGAHRAVVDGEDGLQRVQRAGPDVAEHDPEGGEGERRGLAAPPAVVGARRLGGLVWDVRGRGDVDGVGHPGYATPMRGASGRSSELVVAV